MDENLNMSIRRFLKKVGITSQNEIEKSRSWNYVFRNVHRNRRIGFIFMGCEHE